MAMGRSGFIKLFIIVGVAAWGGGQNCYAQSQPASVVINSSEPEIVYNEFLGPWKVAGPFSVENALEKVTIDDGAVSTTAPLKWKKEKKAWIDVPAGSLNFSRIFQGEKSLNLKAALAVYEFDSPKEQNVILSVAGDDTFHAYLNGKLVLGYETFSGMYLDKLTKEVQLTKGKNRLVIRAFNRNEDWALAARFLPAGVEPIAEFSYHKSFAYGNATFPQATVELLGASGEVLDTEHVDALRSGWALPAIYRVYSPVPKEKISRVRVLTEVPGKPGGKFDKTFSPSEFRKGLPIGEQGDIKVSGKVLDINTSQPVSNVVVRLSETTRTVTTGSDGSFSMDGIDPAAVRLFAMKSGYKAEVEQIDWKHPGEIMFLLWEKGASVVGKVTDTDGKPVAGAEIFTDSLGGELKFYTDENGHYSIDGLSEKSNKGQIGFYIRHPDYAAQSRILVDIKPGESNERDFTLKTGEAYTFNIKDAITGDPISGAKVLAATESGVRADISFSTGNDGKAKLIIGDKTIKNFYILHTDYAPTSCSINSIPDMMPREATVALDHGSTVSRLVVSDKDEIVSAGLAQIYYHQNLVSTSIFSVGKNGLLVWGNVPKEGLDFSFLKDGKQVDRARVKIVPTRADETDGEPAKLELPSNTWISGTLTDAVTEKPITGKFKIYLKSQREYRPGYSGMPNTSYDSYDVVADEFGSFTLSKDQIRYTWNDPNSTVTRTIQVQAPGYKIFDDTSDTKWDREISYRNKSYRLAPLDHIAVRIENPDGSVGSNVNIKLKLQDELQLAPYQMNDGRYGNIVELKTDTDGKAKLPIDLEEQYDLYVNGEKGAIWIYNINKYLDNQTIRMKKHAVLSGFVYNQGKPVADVKVTANVMFSSRDSASFFTRTDTAGNFTFTGLPEQNVYLLAEVGKVGEHNTVFLRNNSIPVYAGKTQNANLGVLGDKTVKGKFLAISDKEGPLTGFVTLESNKETLSAAPIGPNGDYVLEHVPAGNFQIQFRTSVGTPGVSYSSESIEIPADATNPIVFNDATVESKAIKPGEKFFDSAFSAYQIKMTSVKATDTSSVKVALPLRNWYSDDSGKTKIKPFANDRATYRTGRAELWLVINEKDKFSNILKAFGGSLPDYVRIVESDSLMNKWMSAKRLDNPFVIDDKGEVVIVSESWEKAGSDIEGYLDKLDEANSAGNGEKK